MKKIIVPAITDFIKKYKKIILLIVCLLFLVIAVCLLLSPQFRTNIQKIQMGKDGLQEFTDAYNKNKNGQNIGLPSGFIDSSYKLLSGQLKDAIHDVQAKVRKTVILSVACFVLSGVSCVFLLKETKKKPLIQPEETPLEEEANL